MLKNGDFEADEGSGTTGLDEKIVGANILSGASAVSIYQTSPLVGESMLKITGNCEVEWPTVGDTVNRPEFVSFLIRRRGTLTGTLTVKYRSDVAGVATDHATLLTITISGLTADVTYLKKAGFVVPAALGTNPRLVFIYSSANLSGSIEVDELVRGSLSVYDSNRAIAVVDGTTKFRVGDVFTASNTITWTSTVQRMFIELFGRSVKHANPAVYWSIS
jgi:hypothetical protein